MQLISKKLIIIADILSPLKFSKQIKDLLVQATKQKCAVKFDYTSIIDGKTKTYIVMPLQIKTRNLNHGTELVLYGEDINHNNRTKSFVIKSIRNIILDKTNKKRVRENTLEKYFN